MHALFARPHGGTATMIVSVHATETEADAELLRQREKRARHWLMYAGPVVRDEDTVDDEETTDGRA